MNDSMPPPPARLARVESHVEPAEPKNEVFTDAVFGSPPKMIRQMTVDLTDKEAVENVRKNGLYEYLLVNDIEIAVNDRAILLAQLEYLDSV